MSAARGRSSKAQEGNRLPFSRASAFSVLRGSSSSSSSSSGSGGEESDDGDDVTLPKGLKPWQQEGATTSPRSQVEEEESLSSGSSSSSSFDSDGSSEKDQGSQDTSSRAPGEGITRSRGQAVGEHMSPELPSTSNVAAFREERSEAATLLQRVQRGHAVRKRLQPTDDSRVSGNNNNEESKAAAAAVEVQPRSRRLSDTPISQDLSGVGSDSDDDNDSEEPRSQGSTEGSHGPERRAEDVTEGPRTGMIHDERTDDQESDASSADSDQDGDSSSEEEYGEHSVATHSTSETEYAPAVRRGVVGRLLSGLADFLFSSPEPDSAAETGRDSAVSDLESSWGTLVGEETSREQSPEGDDGRSSSLRGSPTIDHHPVSSPLSQPSGLDSVSGSSRSVTPMAAAPSPVDDLVANQDDQAVEETATPSPVGAPEVQSDSVADESPIEEQGGGLLRRGLVRLVQGGLGFFVGSATNEHLDRDDLPDNYRHEQEPEDTSRDSVGDPQRPDSALDSALDALVEGITEVEGGRSDEEKEDSPRVEELSSSSDEKEDDESEAASVTSQGTKGAVRQDAWAIATSVHSQSIGSQDVIAAPAPAIWQHPSPLISASSLQDTFIPSDMLPGVEEKLTRRISDDGTTIAPIKVLYSSTASSKADDAKLLSSAGPAHAPSHAEDHDDFSSMADEIYQGLHSRDDHSHVVGGGPSTSHQDSILWSCGRPNQTWDGLRSQTPSANASESLASLAFNTFKPLTDRQSSRHTWAASPEGDNDVKGTEGARAAEPKEDKGHDAMSAAIWGSKFGMKDDPVGAKLLPVADTKEVLQSSPSRQRGMKPIESPKREQSKSSPLRASASLAENRHDSNNSATSSSDGSRSRSNSSCSGESDAFDGFFTPPLARQQRRGRGRRHRLSPSLVEIKDDHDTDYFQAWDYNTTTNEVQRTPTPASTVTSDQTGDDMTGASGTDDTSSFKSQDDASASSSNPSPVSQEGALSSPVPVLPQIEEVSPHRESSSSSSEGESDESLNGQAAEQGEVQNDVVKVVAVTVIDTKTALIKLQRAWRRSRDRRQRHLTSEAIIQSDQLGALGRHTSDHLQLQASEVRDSGRSEHYSATHIQRLIRGYPRRREFCRVRKATITIQAVVRGVGSRHRHRKQMDSIVRMQAAIRRWLARRNLQGLRAVVRIQARARARAAQTAYLTKLHNRKACAATKIQATYRGLCTRQSYRQVVQARKVSLAAIMIQKHARGLVAHGRFQAFRRAVVAVQSSFRRHRDQRAVVLQQWTRGFIHRRSFLRKLQAVIILQRIGRGFQARRLLARSLHCLRFIQRWYRVVSHCRHSLIKIQAWARGLLARQKYLRCQASVRRIQSWYRCEQKRVSQPDVVQSWDVILKWTHVYKSREKYATIIRSIRAVQLRFRARHDAKVIKVQALWRGILGRRHAAQVLEDTRRQEMVVFKAAEIQRVWRGTLARFVARQIRADQALAKRQQASAALLQRVYRGAVIRREVTVIKETIARQKEEALRWLATVIIQRAWRQHHAYKKICYRRALALVARQHYEEQEPIRRHEAALRIQGMVRHVWFKRRLRYHRVLRVVKVYHCAEYARAYLSAVQIQRAWRNHHGLTYHGPVVDQEEVKEKEEVVEVEELEENRYPQLVNLLRTRKAMTRWLTGGLRLRRLSDPQAHLPEERRVDAPISTDQQAAAEMQIAPPELVEGGGGRLMAILRRRASSQSVGRLEVVEEEKTHTANEASQTMTVETAPVEGQPQPPTTTTTTTTAPPSRRPSITLASLANFILPRRLSAASTSDVRGEEVEDAVDDKDHTCDVREEEVVEKTDEGDDDPERREDTQEKEVEDDLVARPRRRSSFGFFSFDWNKPRANSAAPHDGKIMKEDLMPDSKAKQDGVKTQQAKTEEDDVVELDLAEKRRRGSSLSAPSDNRTPIEAAMAAAQTARTPGKGQSEQDHDESLVANANCLPILLWSRPRTSSASQPPRSRSASQQSHHSVDSKDGLYRVASTSPAYSPRGVEVGSIRIAAAPASAKPKVKQPFINNNLSKALTDFILPTGPKPAAQRPAADTASPVATARPPAPVLAQSKKKVQEPPGRQQRKGQSRPSSRQGKTSRPGSAASRPLDKDRQQRPSSSRVSTPMSFEDHRLGPSKEEEKLMKRQSQKELRQLQYMNDRIHQSFERAASHGIINDSDLMRELEGLSHQQRPAGVDLTPSTSEEADEFYRRLHAAAEEATKLRHQHQSPQNAALGSNQARATKQSTSKSKHHSRHSSVASSLLTFETHSQGGDDQVRLVSSLGESDFDDLSSVETASVMKRLREETKQLANQRQSRREKENVVYNDDVRTRLAIMESYPLDSRQQTIGMSHLRHLSYQPSACQEILNSRGLTIITNAMINHSRVQGIIQDGLHILRALTAKPTTAARVYKFLPHQGLDVIKRARRAYMQGHMGLAAADDILKSFPR